MPTFAIQSNAKNSHYEQNYNKQISYRTNVLLLNICNAGKPQVNSCADTILCAIVIFYTNVYKTRS